MVIKKNSIIQDGNTVGGDQAAGDIHKPKYYIGGTSGGKSQLETLYEQLFKEREESQIFDEIVDELMHFKQQVDGDKIIGLEQKLADGNRLDYLRFAETVKEKFFKKLVRNEHSETAQLIYAFLLAKVYSSFEMNVSPKLKETHPEEYINGLIVEFIVKPIEDILGENLLRVYDDEINGMIYFLTGNCHIKWI